MGRIAMPLPTEDDAVHLVDVGQLGKCSSLDRRNPSVCALLLGPVFLFRKMSDDKATKTHIVKRARAIGPGASPMLQRW